MVVIFIIKKKFLYGDLNQIFKRIIKFGIIGTNKILNQKNIKYRKQNHSKATYFKRRKPEESEITFNELKIKSSKYIKNKIRMLDDPYPNAFIKLKNAKLYIKKFNIK